MVEIKNSQILRIISILILIVLFCPFASGKVIYVDYNAIGANNGTSWENAYVYLQDALSDAEVAIKPAEIHVAQGIYKPYQGSWEKATDSIASFQLINDVTIAGGYAGIGESEPNARDIELYETLLSGDLNGNDIEVNDPCDMLLVEFNRGDNSDHVVRGSDTDASAILDGFTITGGHLMAVSMGPPTGGAGMYITSGSPTIINCTFTGNAASQAGGGLYNIAGCPTLIGCKFENNYAEFGAGMYNFTTMYIPQRSKPILINCSFNGNYSGREGGGMYNFKSDPNLTSCTFTHNFALVYGAGIYNSYSSMKLIDTSFIENTASSGGGVYSEDDCNLALTNCTFKNNLAKYGGGGMSNSDANDILLNNCIFSGNSATRSGGGLGSEHNKLIMINNVFTGNKAQGESLYTGEGAGLTLFGDSILKNCTFCGNWAQQGRAISKYSSSFLELTNCILWDGGDEIFDLVPNSITFDIRYSNIQDGWEGKGNINEDPLFANPGYWADADDPNIVVDPNDPNAMWIDGDYHLKSQAGRWDPNSQRWVQDDMTSPCIDAGDPNSDFSGETWPHGGRINMGAYGGTREASMSTETGGLFLPQVAYIYSYNDEVAENFESLLMSYGCPTTLIRSADVPATPLDSYDLIIVANDTQHEDTWSDPNAVTMIEDSDKSIVGLGYGGYDFFGLLGLTIGSPHGARGSKNSIEVIDPNSSLFSTPYSIEIPEDRALQLYTETNSIGIYLWPTIPETVTVFGNEVDGVGYFPLIAEYNRYILWGFTESPQKMTEVGKTLFINVVIWTANKAWESDK
jgi:predicted outer membrane repeat protein